MKIVFICVVTISSGIFLRQFVSIIYLSPSRSRVNKRLILASVRSCDCDKTTTIMGVANMERAHPGRSNFFYLKLLMYAKIFRLLNIICSIIVQ